MLKTGDAQNGTTAPEFAPRADDTAIAGAPASGASEADYLEESAAIVAGTSSVKAIGLGTPTDPARAVVSSPLPTPVPALVGFDALPGLVSNPSSKVSSDLGNATALASSSFGLAGSALIATGTTIAPDVITTPGSGLVFSNTYNSTVSTSYHAAVVAAEQFLESKFTNSITLNETFSTATGNFVADNSAFGFIVSYAALKSALQSNATTADDAAAVNSLANLTDPSAGAGFFITIADEKALGLFPANSTQTDGTVNLNSGLSYFFDGNPVSGEFDAISALEHELTEQMGRIGGLGLNGNFWGAPDLFRYSAAGVRDFTGGSDNKPAFFSVDGTTLLTQFNDPVLVAGDAADWNPSLTGQAATPVPGGVDSFGASPTGVKGIVTATDLRLMDILGWTPVATSPPPPPVPVVALDSMPRASFGSGGTSDTIGFATDGTISIFATSNGAPTQTFTLGKVGTENTFGAVGHFFGSGAASDFIMRGPQGQVDLYQINNDQVVNAFALGAVGLEFQIVSVGDYFQTGTDDLLMRSSANGGFGLYEMQNGQVTNAVSLGAVGLEQQVVGQGNFFNNGTLDIVTEHDGTGLLGMYQVRNGQTVGSTAFGSMGADAHVIGVGDFNGDRVSDLLIERDSGALQIYEFQNGQVSGVSNLGSVDLAFQPAGVGDFFGNGTDDFLMRSGQTIELFKIQNFQVVSMTNYATLPTSTQIAGAYFNHLV